MELGRIFSAFSKAIMLGLGILAYVSFPARAADQQLIDAARKEGIVVWYTGVVANQLARPVARAFENKYPGIKVDLFNGLLSDIYQKITAEARAGSTRADVVGGFSFASRVIDAGLVEKYVPENAKNYPPQFVDPNGHWIAFLRYYFCAAYNTDLVRAGDAPKSLEDLLDPKWKRKIVWVGGTSGTGPRFVGTILQELGEEKGMDYLRKLAAQDIVNMPANQRVVLDSVIAGEYPIALGAHIHHVAISKAKGAPIQAADVQPYTGSTEPNFLMKNSPHPNAGKLFMDFLISKEGQQLVAASGYIPSSPDVAPPGAGLTPETGNFRAILITPEQYHRSEETIWSKIYIDLFVKG